MNFIKRMFKGPWRYNQLTLRMKFLIDNLRGQNAFLHHGRKVRSAAHLAVAQSQVIWFPTTFFLDRGLAWQTTLAKTLEVRGHHPVFSHLDLTFPRRNGLYFDIQDRGFIMDFYRLYTNSLLAGFGFDHRPMSAFGDTRMFNTYRRQVSSFSRAECDAFTYKDLPIGGYVRNPLIHYFRCAPTTESPKILEARRDFLAMGMVMADIFERAFERIKPTVVVLLNGSFLDSRLQLEMARRRNIRVVTFEAGFMLNALMIGINEPVISFPMAKYLPSAYADYHLSASQERQLDDYLKTRSLGKDCVFDYWGQPIFDQAKIRQELGLATKVVPDILFTNLLWDSAMLDCDIAFANQSVWINDTISWYSQHPDRTLLIRIHPAEINPPHLASQDKMTDVIVKQWPQLPPNVIIIPPTSSISSYPLTALANLTLVYSSTAGLEAAIMGKPVAVVGQTHYRQQGFTLDVQKKAEYYDWLAHPRLPNDRQTIITLARKYAYFFFFGFNIPFPLVNERVATAGGPAVEYKFDHESALLPGRDPSLDFIINVILNRTDYRSRLKTLIS